MERRTTQGAAYEKLDEAARWRDRFAIELREFQRATVRARTLLWMLHQFGRLGLNPGSLLKLSKAADGLHDRRLHAVENMKTSLHCAAASDHAARVLFEEEEKQWTR